MYIYHACQLWYWEINMFKLDANCTVCPHSMSIGTSVLTYTINFQRHESIPENPSFYFAETQAGPDHQCSVIKVWTFSCAQLCTTAMIWSIMTFNARKQNALILFVTTKPTFIACDSAQSQQSFFYCYVYSLIAGAQLFKTNDVVS